MSTGRYNLQIRPRLSKIHSDRELSALTARREGHVFVVVGNRFAGKSTVAMFIARELGGVILPGIAIPGADLFHRVVRAVPEELAGDFSELPRVIVDDMDRADSVRPLFDFFRPFPKVVIVDSARATRLARARKIRPGGWTENELTEADKLIEKKTNALISYVASLGAVVGRIGCNRDFAKLERQVQNFLGQATGGGHDPR